MSTQSLSALVNTELDISLLQDNDEFLTFTISNGATPYNLTGVTLTFYLKASNAVADDTGISITPTVTSATLGEFTVDVPNSSLEASGTMFYHVDAAYGTSTVITTLTFGYVTILPI
jgi:uncharacterized membrane protein